MRNGDVVLIGFGLFTLGGLLYGGLQVVGFNSTQAGIWTQFALVCSLVIWLLTYLFRVGTGNMTYNQQLKDYETAVLQKRLDELTPDELEALQAEIEQERKAKAESAPSDLP
jgi:hypothetical protein